jgi:hypothetical protein
MPGYVVHAIDHTTVDNDELSAQFNEVAELVKRNYPEDTPFFVIQHRYSIISVETHV